MATHTNYGGNGDYGRQFTISRENGQVDKKGNPHFFEWLKEAPTPQAGRKFETRTTADNKQRYYELFRALDGYLTQIESAKKTINQVEQDWLVLHLQDDDDTYTIAVGEISSRYASDIMKRLLDPNFDPNQILRMSPFAIQDGDRENIGIACMSGVDTKLVAGRETNSNLAGIPQATSRVWKGKTEWDFTEVTAWLMNQVHSKVVPKLRAFTPKKQAQPAQTATATLPDNNSNGGVNTNVTANHDYKPENGDDLPF